MSLRIEPGAIWDVHAHGRTGSTLVLVGDNLARPERGNEFTAVWVLPVTAPIDPPGPHDVLVQPMRAGSSVLVAHVTLGGLLMASAFSTLVDVIDNASAVAVERARQHPGAQQRVALYQRFAPCLTYTLNAVSQLERARMRERPRD